MIERFLFSEGVQADPDIDKKGILSRQRVEKGILPFITLSW